MRKHVIVSEAVNETPHTEATVTKNDSAEYSASLYQAYSRARHERNSDEELDLAFKALNSHLFCCIASSIRSVDLDSGRAEISFKMLSAVIRDDDTFNYAFEKLLKHIQYSSRTYAGDLKRETTQ